MRDTSDGIKKAPHPEEAANAAVSKDAWRRSSHLEISCAPQHACATREPGSAGPREHRTRAPTACGRRTAAARAAADRAARYRQGDARLPARPLPARAI